MSREALGVREVVAMLESMADCIIENEPRLSEADRNIGDGDHGLGMKRGMEAAKQKLAEGDFETVDQAFTAVGMAMMSSMGGASGAIFGTLFRHGGKAVEGNDRLDSLGWAGFLRQAADGVTSRGKAQPGDKTIVDAMAPAAEAATVRAEDGLSAAMEATAEAAEAGLEKTKGMVAKFGRAKSLGDAAIGHPDAGALSFALMMRAMSDYVNRP